MGLPGSKVCRAPFEKRILASFARGGPAESMIAGETDGFRRNMLELIRKHPELQKLIQDHANAMASYEKARKKRQGKTSADAASGIPN